MTLSQSQGDWSTPTTYGRWHSDTVTKPGWLKHSYNIGQVTQWHLSQSQGDWSTPTTYGRWHSDTVTKPGWLKHSYNIRQVTQWHCHKARVTGALLQHRAGDTVTLSQSQGDWSTPTTYGRWHSDTVTKPGWLEHSYNIRQVTQWHCHKARVTGALLQHTAGDTVTLSQSQGDWSTPTTYGRWHSDTVTKPGWLEHSYNIGQVTQWHCHKARVTGALLQHTAGDTVTLSQSQGDWSTPTT